LYLRAGETRFLGLYLPDRWNGQPDILASGRYTRKRKSVKIDISSEAEVFTQIHRIQVQPAADGIEPFRRRIARQKKKPGHVRGLIAVVEAALVFGDTVKALDTRKPTGAKVI